jgi:hypothetical protein
MDTMKLEITCKFLYCRASYFSVIVSKMIRLAEKCINIYILSHFSVQCLLEAIITAANI